MLTKDQIKEVSTILDNLNKDIAKKLEDKIDLHREKGNTEMVEALIRNYKQIVLDCNRSEKYT